MTRTTRRPSRFRIRAIVATVALLLAVSGCARGGTIVLAGNGDCQQMYKIAYQVYPGSTVNLWPDIAEKQGFFAKNCVKGIAQVVNSGPAALAQLASGDLQTMMSTPDNFVQARSNGFKLKMVATAATRASLGFIVAEQQVAQNEPIEQAIRGLKGKTIGVNSQGSQMQYFAAALLRQYGVDPASVEFAGLGTPASMLASLQRGNVQAAVFDSQYNDMVTSLDFGTKYSDMRFPVKPGVPNPTPMPKVFQPMQGMASSYAFTDQFLSEYPKAAQAWQAAISEAANFALDPANKERVRQIEHEVGRVVITDATPNAAAIFNTAVDAAAASSNKDAAMDPALLQIWIDWTSKARKIAKPPSVGDLMWNGG